MNFHIGFDRSQRKATLKFSGNFDLKHGFALFQYCQLEGQDLRKYHVDLGDITHLTEFGLDSLKKFICWGEARGLEVAIINAHPDHADQCRRWGIPTKASPAVPAKVASDLTARKQEFETGAAMVSAQA